MADFNDINATPDYTSSLDPQDVRQNRGISVLAYLGLLVLIPLFAAKDSPYARFHCNQGIVLFIAELIISAVFRILRGLPLIGWIFGIVLALVSIATFVLTIIGIVNAANGRAKELPIIGTIQILQ